MAASEEVHSLRVCRREGFPEPRSRIWQGPEAQLITVRVGDHVTEKHTESPLSKEIHYGVLKEIEISSNG